MREKLLKAIEKKGDLPPLPKIIDRLRVMIEDPDVGINEVAQVIQTDPVLTGRLIQLSNSVFCRGIGYGVTGVTGALGRLGLKMAMDIAYSLEVPKLFHRTKVINQKHFWQYSIGLAVMSSKFAERFGADRDEQSNAYLGGLMRNIGVLVFAHLIPNEYEKFLDKIQILIQKEIVPNRDLTTGITIEPLEEKVFGITNSELGTRFIQRWWPVAPSTIEYVQNRNPKLSPTLGNCVNIANLFLYAEKTPNGIYHLESKETREFLQTRYNIDDEDYDALRSDLIAAMKIVG
jgi:hypothetical protein